MNTKACRLENGVASGSLPHPFVLGLICAALLAAAEGAQCAQPSSPQIMITSYRAALAAQAARNRQAGDADWTVRQTIDAPSLSRDYTDGSAATQTMNWVPAAGAVAVGVGLESLPAAQRGAFSDRSEQPRAISHQPLVGVAMNLNDKTQFGAQAAVSPQAYSPESGAAGMRPVTLSLEHAGFNLGKSLKGLTRMQLSNSSAVNFKLRKSFVGVTYAATW